VQDGSGNERTAALLLVAAIVLIGVAPFLINDIISPSTEKIMEQLNKLVSSK